MAIEIADFPIKHGDVPLKMVIFPLKIVIVPLNIVIFPLKIVSFPIKNVDFPIKHGGSFHSYGKLPEATLWPKHPFLGFRKSYPTEKNVLL